MSKYKHIFFDLDRTLWDFEANSEEVLQELFNKYKIAKKGNANFDLFISIYREINTRLWKKYRLGSITKEFLSTERFYATISRFGIGDRSIAQQMGEDYVRISPQKTRLFDNTIEVLTELKKNYKLHIITNGFGEVQTIKIENSGLTDFFEEIIISEHTPWKKPQSEIFKYAMNQADTNFEECIMIGDDLTTDIKGAASVGMNQIWVNFDNTPAGFKPTYTINKLNQILDIL